MTAIEGELLPLRGTSGEALVSEMESTGVEPCPAGPTARRPSRTPGRHRSAQVGMRWPRSRSTMNPWSPHTGRMQFPV